MRKCSNESEIDGFPSTITTVSRRKRGVNHGWLQYEFMMNCAVHYSIIWLLYYCYVQWIPIRVYNWKGTNIISVIYLQRKWRTDTRFVNTICHVWWIQKGWKKRWNHFGHKNQFRFSLFPICKCIFDRYMAQLRQMGKEEVLKITHRNKR